MCACVVCITTHLIEAIFTLSLCKRRKLATDEIKRKIKERTRVLWLIDVVEFQIFPFTLTF